MASHDLVRDPSHLTNSTAMLTYRTTCTHCTARRASLLIRRHQKMLAPWERRDQGSSQTWLLRSLPVTTAIKPF